MDVPEFEDPKWVMDLAFLVDITQELNVLNLKLQDPGQLITAAYESVKAFSTKLRLWETQLSAKNLSHFTTCRSLVEQTELIHLQCNTELKNKFRDAKGNADKTAQFLRELPPRCPELSKVLSRLLCLFGSTYLCEKLFFTMNFNKCKFRSRLSDAHLEAVLRVSTMNSIRENVAQLCEQKCCQVSGQK
ncbi:General transcription factor II-I repeat domain-containing protein 2 [Triplophysa tibetana]|uniref:General transcription factor II-I repeat domain-containing protein 2 n=1 Tax=Triplophysa tibetana TaxID=1572043 RepID=A0A5A9NXR7_9TELE|nr:General transcription factor II-I repeat domain-containing protein 2 [Triplophysa tibetana]